MCADDFAVPRATLDFPFITDEDLAVYLESWRRPGGMAGPLAWYRREGLGPPDRDGTPARGNYAPEVTPMKVDVPTLVVYPEDDLYTRPPAHEGVDRYVSDLTFRTIEGGSHWIAEDRPDLVNEHIREFLRVRAVAFAASG
jgi:pimeloyl-ACP methyl ester carboxylesterase